MVKAKEIEGLNCEGRAAQEIRLVLCARMEEMCRLRAAALLWSEPKGVHDMRVASRRLRSALRDFKPYLRKRRLASSARELKRVADALGAVRDADVAIMALEKLQQEAPANVTAGITNLADERRAEREAARAALVDAIEEERLDRLRSEFAAALERATKLRRAGGKRKSRAAELSFREVGGEIIRARLAELRDVSALLYQPFDTPALHRIRIAAKRLRYSMQLFAPCCDQSLAEQSAEVAQLQTSLGDLHDGDVWLEDFGQRLRDFQKRVDDRQPLTETDEQQRRAAVWLMRHFAKARMKHFGHALARWHEWETSNFFTRIGKSLLSKNRLSVTLSN